MSTLTNSTAVRVRTTLDPNTFNTRTIAGPARFQDGVAETNLPIATALCRQKDRNGNPLNHYTPFGDEDKQRIDAFVQHAVETASGPYEPGEKVTVHCEELAGLRTRAGDGISVQFDDFGTAVCGLNTARRLQMAHPKTLTIQMPEAVAPVSNPEPVPAAVHPVTPSFLGAPAAPVGVMSAASLLGDAAAPAPVEETAPLPATVPATVPATPSPVSPAAASAPVVAPVTTPAVIPVAIPPAVNPVAEGAPALPDSLGN